MKTTLNRVLKYRPCGMTQEGDEKTGRLKLLAYLGKTEADDEPLSILTILDSNGIQDAIWAFRAVSGNQKFKRQFAHDCAYHVLHIWEKWGEKHKPEKKDIPRETLAVVQRYINDEATDEELASSAYSAYASSSAYSERKWQATHLREMLAAGELKGR